MEVVSETLSRGFGVLIKVERIAIALTQKNILKSFEWVDRSLDCFPRLS